jgi:hypothetical protein
MQIALLRVGADSGNLGFHAPLFEDGSFEFIPINDLYNVKNSKSPIDERRTYSNTKGRSGKPLLDYFPENKKNKHKDSIIHFDPEFESFTYGDPSRTKKGLTKLEKGDYLIFYSSLTEYPLSKNSKTALYVIGYFEVDESRIVKNVKEYDDVKKKYGKNFHVRHRKIFDRDVSTAKNNGLKLVKGSKNSKLLKKAYPISEWKPFGKDGKCRFVISKKMQKIFGDFGGKVCIQRNALRYVEEGYVQSVSNWINELT